MKVYVNEDENEPLSEESALLQSEEELDSNINKAQVISFTNGKILTTLSVLTFLVISFFNFYLIVAFLRGKDVQF
jgi:Mn2+/Fe2+ NRAMP family transporter